MDDENKIMMLALAIWAVSGLSMALDMETKSPVIELGSRRELFVDHFLIERMEKCRLMLHEPRDEGVVLKFDQPWEGPFCGYCTVIHDGEKYRLYYRGLPLGGKDLTPFEMTCYAESADGINWVKPKLGLYEVQGTRENNVVLANAAPVTHNFSPFLDTRPDVPQTERFKGLGGHEQGGGTFRVCFS